MKMKHLLIECFCDVDEVGEYPCNSTFEMGINCLECHRVSFAKSPNEIAYASENGIVESINDFIGFGGEMIVDINLESEHILKWKDICLRKIQEAYSEYMETIKRYT